MISACNSGTEIKNETTGETIASFAQALSCKLGELGYSNITVFGYLGSINELKGHSRVTTDTGNASRASQHKLGFKNGHLLKT